MDADLGFAPLIPWSVWAVLAAAAAAVLVTFAVRRPAVAAWRVPPLAVLLLALAGPQVAWEDRRPEPDVAVLVLDQSASQGIGGRTPRSAAAAAAVRAAAHRFTDLDLLEVRTASGRGAEGTRLNETLIRALAEVPEGRFAGAVLITDGQVHDADDSQAVRGPVHLLLSGERGERDRRIEVLQRPSFGLVGGSVAVGFRVRDAGNRVPVEVVVDGNRAQTLTVPGDTPVEATVPIDHAGPTVIELALPPAEGDVSPLNDRAAVEVNGVRERLQVLLISGRPHPGERVWRNLLKSDPAVDLIHFTILRPADKVDPTPLRELALIGFPTAQLFEDRLADFDLVVFDRYVVRHMLSPDYYMNLVNYVQGGGAVLVAAGPEFAGAFSPAGTLLGEVLPVAPVGSRLIEGRFVPEVSDIGRRHPVTEPLAEADSGDSPWGAWYRLVATEPLRGRVLMTGTDGLPLLVLDEAGDGRVAVLTSDQAWLWARGHDGGGPHGELLRRMVHWLMREPDLEAERLTARVADGRLAVRMRTLDDPKAAEAVVETPDGAAFRLPLDRVGPGRLSATRPAELPGTYRIRVGERSALAVGGDLKEFADLRTTPDLLSAEAARSGGGVFWLADGVPDLRRVGLSGTAHGRGWMGLRRNGAERVVGTDVRPLLPGPVLAVLALALFAGAWWREGK